MPSHPDKEQISAYYDGALSAPETKGLDVHLRECGECRAYLNELRTLSGALRTWAPESPSADLEARLKKIASAGASKGEKTMKKNPYLAAGIGSTVFIAIMAFAVYRYMPPLEQTRPLPVTLPAKTAPVQPPAQPVLPSKPVDEAARAGKLKVREEAEFFREKKEATLAAASVSQEASQVRRAFGGAATLKNQSIISYASMADMTAGGARLSSSVYDASMMYSIAPVAEADFNTESYDKINEGRFLRSAENPLSTFSIDVDTASYANVRRYLTANQLPPADSVRIEELVNYFSYDYPQPAGSDPVSITTEVVDCAWKEGRQIALVGIQAKSIDLAKAPASNLVFLIDVSGSMNSPDKLPLVKSALRMLVDQIRPQDKVSIVVYAGAAGIVLEAADGNSKPKIIEALDRLEAGGSTAGGAGIKLAYDTAKKHFIQGGNNRVILATDGDFNVGASSDGEMTRLIEERRNDGVFLNVLGFGTGNYKDSKMEALADKGNGQAAYIDSLLEAKKVFVNQLGSTLFTVAKDVKIQVEFNPAKVKAYRLIGYENRMLAKEDFNDDKKDAGEMGAGHTVTALYEIIPADSKEEVAGVDDLKYQKTSVSPSNDLFTVKVRYKEPAGDASKLLVKEVPAKTTEASNNLAWASSVAEFGLLLRNSEYKGTASYDSVLKRAKAAKGADDSGYRAEFIRLVELADILEKGKK